MTNSELDNKISKIESKLDSMEGVINMLISRIEYRDKVLKAMESYLGIKRNIIKPQEETVVYVKDKTKKRRNK